jgi:hypothetical protein
MFHKLTSLLGWKNTNKIEPLPTHGDPVEPRRSVMSGIVAARANSFEYMDLWGYLPDPDPILQNAGLVATALNDLLADSHVIACYQSRKGGVLSGEWRIAYPSGSSRYSKYFDRLIADLPIESVISQFLDAPFFGYSVNEVQWKMTNGKWVPVVIEQKPHHWFVFDKQNRLRFLSKNNQLEGTLLPDYKFIVPRYFPTYENPYGIRLLSRCFWPVVFKKAGYRFWTKFMERFGIPWITGKVPRNTDQATREALLSDLLGMVQSAVSIINDDESIEALQVGSGGGKGNENTFDQMINSSNGEISKAILTQTLTTEVGDKGAYAASQSHLSVRNDICEMDRKLVAQHFNLLFRWCCKLNFGDNVPVPTFNFVEADDPKEGHSRRDSTLATSMHVRFKEPYLERTYNLFPGEYEVKEPEPIVPSPMTIPEDGENPADKPNKDGKDDNQGNPVKRNPPVIVPEKRE